MGRSSVEEKAWNGSRENTTVLSTTDRYLNPIITKYSLIVIQYQDS